MAIISFSEIKSKLNTLSQEMLAIVLSSIKQRTAVLASANTLRPFYNLLTSGPLTVGRFYEITVSAGGADFTNVGAADNNVGTQFKAIGTTPISWGAGELAEAQWSGNTINISGTTTINTISGKFLNYGDRIRLVFSESLILTDSAGTSGDDCEMVLGTDLNTLAVDEIELQLRNDDKFYPIGGNIGGESSDYKTLIVTTEAELIAAYLKLNAVSGGLILFGADITLTADRTFDNDNITVDLLNNTLYFDSFKITVTNRTCNFKNGTFSGNVLLIADTTDTLFLFNNADNLTSQFDFASIKWLNIIGTDYATVPIFDTNGCGGVLGFYFSDSVYSNRFESATRSFSIKQYATAAQYIYTFSAIRAGDLYSSNPIIKSFMAIGSLLGGTAETTFNLNVFSTDGSFNYKPGLAFTNVKTNVRRDFVLAREEKTTFVDDDSIIISDSEDDGNVKFIKRSTINNGLTTKGTKTERIPYWYNTINDQTADYLFDNAANVINKLFLRIDDAADGGDSATYKIKKATFFCKDPNGDATTNAVISIYKNATTIMSSTVTIPITTDAAKVTGFDTDLFASINSALNSFAHGDYINIYVTTGTGSAAGSQIDGYFIFEYEEV